MSYSNVTLRSNFSDSRNSADGRDMKDSHVGVHQGHLPEYGGSAAQACNNVSENEFEQDITDNPSTDSNIPEPPCWGGLPISQKDVFHFAMEKDTVGDYKYQAGHYPDQYAHFSKPFIINKNRDKVNRTRNTATIYRRNLLFLMIELVIILTFFLDFYDYYTDLFRYLQGRQMRYATFLNEKDLSEGSIHKALRPSRSHKSVAEYFAEESAGLRKRRLKPRLSDFHKITQIGQGAFGEIHLVRQKFTRQICALKTIPKLHIQRKDQQLQILTERDILASAKYPHLVKLLYSFQDDRSLYLAMEYLPGGDFRTFLNASLPLALDEIKFYFLEMVFAVSSVHELGYIHRDVKPENFLIDARGHLKLTDFGLACGNLSQKRIVSLQAQFSKDSMSFDLHPLSSTSSGGTPRLHPPVSAPAIGSYVNAQVWSEETVGSVDYMAVEVVQRSPYNNTVDFWSLGCLLYEMFTSKTPFHGNPALIVQWPEVLRNRPRICRPTGSYSHTKLNSNTQYYDDVCFGSSMPILHQPLNKSAGASVTVSNSYGEGFIDDYSWDLITRLITSQNRRFQTSSEILQHLFFSTMTIENRITPPFVPSLDHDADCKYFDDFDSPDIQNMYVDIILHRKNVESRLAMDPNAKNGYHKKYLGFTFRRQK